MTRRRRWLAIAAGIVILIAVAPFVWYWGFVWLLGLHSVPSKIVDFRPTPFEARTDTKFFYSVGNELKYSDQIDPKAPTLYRGDVGTFLVSPDNRKIAFVANRELVVVGAESGLWRIAAVDSIIREPRVGSSDPPKPIGVLFFRDEDFQWSRDSTALYLIRDEYELKGSERLWSKGELWKYDLGAGTLRLVLENFKAYHYFLGKGAGVYFSVRTESGDFRLRYFDGQHFDGQHFDGQRVKDIGEPNATDIPLGGLSTKFVESPFYSFSNGDYEHDVLPAKRVELVDETDRAGQKAGPERLVIRGQSYLTLTLGVGFLGVPQYCSDRARNVLLPGDRYFLFNVSGCGNYSGQLLIDTFTGKYQRLPADSAVYLTLNTDTYPSYRIGSNGLDIK